MDYRSSMAYHWRVDGHRREIQAADNAKFALRFTICELSSITGWITKEQREK